MTMTLPQKSWTRQRWEEQVQKAFLRPSPDWILRMATRMRVEETTTKQRGPTKTHMEPTKRTIWLSLVSAQANLNTDMI